MTMTQESRLIGSLNVFDHGDNHRHNFHGMLSGPPVWVDDHVHTHEIYGIGHTTATAPFNRTDFHEHWIQVPIDAGE